MVERRRFIAGSGDAVPRYQFNTRLLDDLIAFSQLQYKNLDYDPFHPMLVELGRGLPEEDALWLSTLYMAFYNIGSAWAAFKNCDRLKPLPDWMGKLPIGVQRRNLYGGKVLVHLASFSEIVKSQHDGYIRKFLTARFFGNVRDDWSALKGNVGQPWGNGRWSVYTTSELYQKVNRIPVRPFEIGNQGSTGPRSGLCRLYDLPNPKQYSVELLDSLADRLFGMVAPKLSTEIFYLPKGHYDHGMLESQLCDFNSMCKGNYYPGRDIDRDQERIYAAERVLRMLNVRTSLAEVWAVRAKVFNARYLGEVQGWLGRTEEANTYYHKTGVIADHKSVREALRVNRLF